MQKVSSSQAAVVVLNWVKHSFSLWLSLKPNRKSTDSSKRRYSAFSKCPSVWEIDMFLLEIFTIFNILTLHQIFWITKNFFKKLEYVFLVESIKIENATLPYKTALSEANIKKIEWRVQNGAITRNGVFSVTTLFFWKFCFSLRTSYKEYHLPKCQYSYFL